MAGRTIHKLSDAAVRGAKAGGRYSDGGGLYLNVAAGGSKSWLFMWTPRGTKSRREMGLGGYPAVTLAKARSRAAECRSAISEGRDPIVERDEGEAPTFGQAAEAYIDALAADFRNAKHLYQWRMTLSVQRDEETAEYLETGYCLTLRTRRVDQVNTEDVLTVLKPIWREIPETAGRIRGRIERILDAEKAVGHREGENPARWRGHLDKLLTRRSKLSRGHHPAMPYEQVPAFMAKLRAVEGVVARALEFTILTVARSGETRGGSWSEVNETGKLWTVPAERMKAGEEHDVPLPPRALDIIREMREAQPDRGINDPLLFPSPVDPRRPMSNMAMLMLLRRMTEKNYTVHGFRSSFRDWCGDETAFAREVAEAALAHKVGNDVEQAYRRSTALEKRRRLMDAWARYCSAPTKLKNNVVHIGDGKRTA